MKKIIDFIISLIYPKTAHEKRSEYLKKYGYPDETKTFSDSYGTIVNIIGKNKLKKIINNPVMKRISKEISQKGYSCPESWKYDDNKRINKRKDKIINIKKNNKWQN